MRLSDKLEVRVRFNEADPLGIVWHGHYLRYFEDGREAFGTKHGLGYLDVYKKGFVIPIVSINCDYKKSLVYGATAIVETIFINTPAAKLIFDYKIYEAGTMDLVATGRSVQVFLELQSRQLHLSTPEFYEEWKRQHNLL